MTFVSTLAAVAHAQHARSTRRMIGERFPDYRLVAIPWAHPLPHEELSEQVARHALEVLQEAP